jgi:ribonuclease BN (tRNA processing enzyme)
MKIFPLGVGGAFTERFYHNNFIFELGNVNLLVDAGTTLRYSLNASGFALDDIDYILITHFHSDHSGGLEEFLQRCYFRFEKGEHKPHRPTLLMMESQMEQFNHVLSSGLYNQNLTLTDYCNVQVIPNVSKQDFYIELESYRVEMINTSNLHVHGMHSFAFKVTDIDTNRNVFFTSDIKHLEKSNFLLKIDLETKAIFHDLQLQRNPVHVDLEEIISYYPESYYDKIYVMHYPDHINHHSAQITSKGLHIVEQGRPLIFK